jgi:hypothetical protein
MICLALAALSLAGCASNPPATSPPEPLVWPAAPEAPRIAYVRSIERPADVGIRPSRFSRAINWIIGTEKGDEPLVKPFGIALDEQDNVCLTDTATKAVIFYDRSAKTWQRWDTIGAIKLVSPVAIAKRNGTIFVADSGLSSVLAFNTKGKLLFQISNHLERPCALAIETNRLFVVDSQRHCVAIFDLTGHYQSEFGKRGTGEGEFNFPTHISTDAAGNLYVTDSINSRVQVFDGSGKFLRQLGAAGDSGGSFSRPKGVAVDRLDHVYVVDGMFDNIQIFDRENHFLLNVGDEGRGPGQFWLPNGIAIGRTNEIFVSDCYNRRIQVFQYVGQQ